MVIFYNFSKGGRYLIVSEVLSWKGFWKVLTLNIYFLAECIIKKTRINKEIKCVVLLDMAHSHNTSSTTFDAQMYKYVCSYIRQIYNNLSSSYVGVDFLGFWDIKNKTQMCSSAVTSHFTQSMNGNNIITTSVSTLNSNWTVYFVCCN